MRTHTWLNPICFFLATVVMAGVANGDQVNDSEAKAEYYKQQQWNTEQAKNTPEKMEAELKAIRDQHNAGVVEDMHRPPVGFAHYDKPVITGNASASEVTMGGWKEVSVGTAAGAGTPKAGGETPVIPPGFMVLLIAGIVLVTIGCWWRRIDQKKVKAATPGKRRPG